jgi:acetyl-CoA acetyltransferase
MAVDHVRDRTAIVGVGETDFGPRYRTRDPELTSYDLAAEAFTKALADAGLERDEVDGLICARVPNYTRMATVLGLRHPRVVNCFEGTGRMSGVALQAAVAAVTSCMASVVACVYGNNGRSAGATYGGTVPEGSTADYDAMYGMTSPGAYVGLMYRRYQHEFKPPEDALAPVAINNRKNGALNPNAVMQAPITHEEYMSSRFVAEPLRLFDYCIINDGGVAFIVTIAERAAKLAKPPVYVSATAARADLTNFYTSPDSFQTACRSVADEVFKAAQVTPADIDVAEIYDNFTPTVLFSLEGFGFAKPGQSWEWIRDGRIELGGDLPVNTSGGHTAESYMQGWALHVEAVRQLRGEAGPRQVSGAKVAQYICASPVTTSHILRS